MMLPLLCSDSLHMQATYAVAALAAAAHGGDLPLAQTQALLSAVEGPGGWPADALHYAPVRLHSYAHLYLHRGKKNVSVACRCMHACPDVELHRVP